MGLKLRRPRGAEPRNFGDNELSPGFRNRLQAETPASKPIL
jgi:hypothetical protein